jgi:hypothetical protein
VRSHRRFAAEACIPLASLAKLLHDGGEIQVVAVLSDGFFKDIERGGNGRERDGVLAGFAERVLVSRVLIGS